MLRHGIALNPECCIPAKSLLDNLHARWPGDASRQVAIRHPLGHLGRFRIAVSGDVLEIAGDIAEPHGWSFSPRQPYSHWFSHDHVVCFFDPLHDHTTRRMLAVLRTGEVHREDTWRLCGEEVSDIQTKDLKLPPIDAEAQAAPRKQGGWRMRLRVKMSSLDPSGKADCRHTPIGLMLKMAVSAPTMYCAPTWPQRHPFWKDAPFANGDVLSPDPPLIVHTVDFGKPVWKTGPVSSSIRIEGVCRRKVSGGVWDIAVTDTLRRTSTTSHAWRAKAKKFLLKARVDYPFTSKWAPDIMSIARIAFTIRDANGGVLWSASYPFGFDAGVIVREPFGMLPRKGIERPNADDPGFVDKFRTWLLSKLPDYKWLTTRRGAPSDFYLKADTRGDDLNLMQPGAFRNIAKLIRRKFDDWQDALCAAAMFLHHPCLTVHSSSWAKVADNSHTETVLRLGGCFCSDCARIAARLAEELGRLYRLPLRGFSLGLHGHLTGLVETPIGDVLIDPMLGTYYHTLDNRRLATLDEMREDIRIQQRMWPLACNHGHEFFYKIYNQEKVPWDEGPTVFPPE